ncbi:MAG: bifunctional UDP-N-acetylglucosamine diphosphorylase/glucosamine-1-phosphate N-acetyltransferase GlmU [Chloroflexota bacterium]|nr:bifunctional UDP-N-acetylglucosamine diphosphorylase/glucosamine-1-phosphate N-acetyltransferase GlmU [Chloroflexota bacterium]
MSTKAAVILAAGKGVRMRSSLSKVLHKICGKELVRHVVDAAKGAGYDRVVVIVSPSNESPVRDLLGDTVEYAVQCEMLGTGHAALQAKDLLSDVETVAVLSGDVPLIRPQTLSGLLELHEAKDALATLLTARCDIPGLAKVVRNSDGAITEIVEERDADESTRAIGEVNVGSYCFEGPWLWDALERVEPSDGGEYYLPAVVAMAVQQGSPPESVEVSDPSEALGINDRVQLSEAESILRERIRLHWMKNGVTMPDPSSVYIDADVRLGQDTTVLPNTHINGASNVGERCVIGPNSIIDTARIGSDCLVRSSVVEGSELEARVNVGPFAHVRPGSHIAEGVVLGNFAEVNRSTVGRNSKAAHFTYLGDAQVGEDVNIGAGTVTVNYDGESKLPTRIGDGAFIGCDTMLVAPVEIGAGAQTGAGAVVTKDVPPDELAVGVPARVNPKNKRKSDGGGDSS